MKLFCQCKDKQISLSSDVTTSSFSQPIENEVDIFESMDNAANTTTINRETERERGIYIDFDAFGLPLSCCWGWRGEVIKMGSFKD